MGTQTETHKKSARTRAENAERERQESARMIEETAAGRAAKHQAMRNAVWKIKPRNGRRVAQPGVKTTKTQRKAECPDVESEDEGDDTATDLHKISSGNIDDARTRKFCNMKSTGGTGTRHDDDDSTNSSSKSSGEPSGDEANNDDCLGSDFQDELAFVLEDESTQQASNHFSSVPTAQNLFNITDESQIVIANAYSLRESRGQSPGDLGMTDEEGMSRHGVPKQRSSAKGNAEVAIHKSRKNFQEVNAIRRPTIMPEKAKATMHKFHKRSRMEVNSSDEENLPPYILPTKKSKVKSHREEAFDAERPRIQTAAVDITKAKGQTAHNVSDSERSAEVQLKPNVVAKGAKRKLMEQPFVLQAIIRHAITQATDDVLLRKNWPEENNRSAYGKERLLKACRDKNIIHTYNVVAEVKTRIKKDPEFMKGLSDLVVDRLSSVCGSAKIEAAKHLPGYQLGLGETCKERVEYLLQDLRFHSLGHWGGNNGNEWVPEHKGSFKNLALIGTIRDAYFSNTRAVGYRYVDRFSSSVATKPDEKEIPIPLLTLSLTGLYSCLYEFRSGKKENLDFNGATFRTINQSFANILEKLQRDRPLEFHERMHDIFDLVVGKESSPYAGDMEINAFRIIDF